MIKKTTWIFYNSVFPREAKMCLGFLGFPAPPAALKRKKLSEIPKYAAIYDLFAGATQCYERSPFDVIFSN